MAESKKARIRKPQTVRERVENVQNKEEKPRRIRKSAEKVARQFKAAATVGRKEYYLSLPDSRVFRFLNKRRSFIPRFFREAWAELKQVSWPNRKETFKLTTAVFIFAIAFGLIIAITDYGLDKLFRKVLLQ